MTTEAQSPPDITRLEARAVSVLESLDCLEEARERVEQRSAQHLMLTFAFNCVGIKPEYLSRDYRQTRSWVRAARKQFMKGYNDLYPHYPLTEQEYAAVAKAVFELCNLDLDEFNT